MTLEMNDSFCWCFIPMSYNKFRRSNMRAETIVTSINCLDSNVRLEKLKEIDNLETQELSRLWALQSRYNKLRKSKSSRNY